MLVLVLLLLMMITTVRALHCPDAAWRSISR
jgi:hypothetical protein